LNKITQKYFKKNLEVIDAFTAERKLKVVMNKKYPSYCAEIEISKSDKNNFVEFNMKLKEKIRPEHSTFKRLGFSEDFQIISQSSKYIVPERSVIQITSKNFVETDKIKGHISKIYSVKFPIAEISCFRLILPIEIDHYTTIFLGSKYKCDDVEYGLGLINIKIEDVNYQIFRVNNNKQNYLLIDCMSKIRFDNFINVSKIILKNLGLITGKWFQKEWFVLSHENSEFNNSNKLYYESLSNSIITNSELINPHEFRDFMDDGSENKPKLTDLLFPEKILEKLIVNQVLNPNLERTVNLLVEGNASESGVIRCSIFLIALETIVNYIYIKNKEYFHPIKNSKSLIDLIRGFIIELNKKKKSFNEIEFKAIKKKLEYINTPFNKDKFILSYQFYNLNLPEKLKETLGTRNLFLHGSLPSKGKKLRLKENEIHLYADRLHLLVALLLLKNSGYRGHVKNLATYRLILEEYYEEMEFEEDLGQHDSSFYKI